MTKLEMLKALDNTQPQLQLAQSQLELEKTLAKLIPLLERFPSRESVERFSQTVEALDQMAWAFESVAQAMVRLSEETKEAHERSDETLKATEALMRQSAAEMQNTLKQRVSQLGQPTPRSARQKLGIGLLAGAFLALPLGGYLAWQRRLPETAGDAMKSPCR